MKTMFDNIEDPLSIKKVSTSAFTLDESKSFNQKLKIQKKMLKTVKFISNPQSSIIGKVYWDRQKQLFTIDRGA